MGASAATGRNALSPRIPQVLAAGDDTARRLY